MRRACPSAPCRESPSNSTSPSPPSRNACFRGRLPSPTPAAAIISMAPIISCQPSNGACSPALAGRRVPPGIPTRLHPPARARACPESSAPDRFSHGSKSSPLRPRTQVFPSICRPKQISQCWVATRGRTRSCTALASSERVKGVSTILPYMTHERCRQEAGTMRNKRQIDLYRKAYKIGYGFLVYSASNILTRQNSHS